MRMEGLEMIINNLCEVVKTAVNKRERQRRDRNPNTATNQHITLAVRMNVCFIARGMRLCTHTM